MHVLCTKHVRPWQLRDEHGITPVLEKPTGQGGDNANATLGTGALGSTCTRAAMRRETDSGEEGPLNEQPPGSSALPGPVPPRPEGAGGHAHCVTFSPRQCPRSGISQHPPSAARLPI